MPRGILHPPPRVTEETGEKLSTTNFTRMKKTNVRNVITEEVCTFVNDLSLKDNLINQIIYNQKQVGNLLNPETRAQVEKQNDIREAVSTITKKPFVYCIELNLIATYENETTGN